MDESKVLVLLSDWKNTIPAFLLLLLFFPPKWCLAAAHCLSWPDRGAHVQGASETPVCVTRTTYIADCLEDSIVRTMKDMDNSDSHTGRKEKGQKRKEKNENQSKIKKKKSEKNKTTRNKQIKNILAKFLRWLLGVK